MVYRRTREEMPATADEVNEAEEEGVDLLLLTSPLSVVQQDGRADRRGLPADGAGRARRERPAASGAGPRVGVHHRPPTR